MYSLNKQNNILMMVKKGIKITADPNLVNFHFTNTPTTLSVGQQQQQQHHHNHGVGSSTSMTRPRSGSFNNNNNKNNSHHHHRKNHHYRTAEDRASSRKKISTHMFPLHSSPDHAFVISRCGGNVNIHHETNNLNANSNYTFQGPDLPVSWESVRIVKCFTPITTSSVDNCLWNDDERKDSALSLPAYIPCPICLDENCVCPRITKCGHTFCYTCILHHIQTYNDKTTNPKCPCCSLPIYINDLRPIQIIPIQSPVPTLASKQHINDATTPTIKMRFIKLHRNKYCHTSYIPSPSEPRRLSPNAIPCHTIDQDAIYSKFNYLHVPTYHQLLQTNLDELRSSFEQQQQQYHMTRRSMSMMEDMVFGLAIQSLQSQLYQNPMTSPHYHKELQLQQRFLNSGSGFYSLQIPSLIYHHGSNNNHTVETEHCLCNDDQPLEGSSTFESMSTSWDVKNCDGEDDNNHSNPPQDHHPPQQRDRGNSITSVQSCSTSNSMNSIHKYDQPSIHNNATTTTTTKTTTIGGSVYATNEEYILYQAHDGSLCFLSGFNMNCLRTEYASTLLPEMIHNNTIDCGMEQLSINQLWDDSNNHTDEASGHKPTPPQKLQTPRPTRPPLPDFVDGFIMEIERVLLTPEVRERRRFLSHIPLYTEVCFIEIDINHLLSARTKNVYKKEFTKRKQVRLAREKAEQREDELLKLQEQEKINERKARIQQIDPMDDFFQPVVPMHADTEINMLSDDFGPSISSSITNETVGSAPLLSFSQACKSAPTALNATASSTLPSLTETNFPALGSSPPNQKTNMTKKKVPPPPKLWSSNNETDVVAPAATTVTNSKTATFMSSPLESVPHDAGVVQSQSPESGIVAPPVTAKKSKNKKIVLFSTGAHRNDYF